MKMSVFSHLSWWYCGVEVISSAQIPSTKPQIPSNHARAVSEIRDDWYL